MSLEKLGFKRMGENVEITSAKKQKKDETYDREKRCRQFLPSWLDEFPWLELREEKMFCKVCSKYPLLAVTTKGKDTFVDSGSDCFHKGTPKAHDGSRCHLHCVVCHFTINCQL